jgi:hypothetical protein
MDYLLEIADRLLPSVKAASEEVSPNAFALNTANAWFKAARRCVVDERKKRDAPRVPECQPPEGVLDKETNRPCAMRGWRPAAPSAAAFRALSNP